MLFTHLAKSIVKQKYLCMVLLDGNYLLHCTIKITTLSYLVLHFIAIATMYPNFPTNAFLAISGNITLLYHRLSIFSRNKVLP